MKKKRAGIEYLSSVMLICLAGIIIMFCYDYRNVRMCQVKLKDSIDISALAAAVADRNTFEKEGKIEINEMGAARMRFEEYLKYNLELNDNMMPDMTKAYDKISIHKFSVYHVVNNDYVVRYDINSDYQYVTQYMEFNGAQKTPDGKVIEGETIYVEIGTKIKGFLNQKDYQYIRSCVDIVSSTKEENVYD